MSCVSTIMPWTVAAAVAFFAAGNGQAGSAGVTFADAGEGAGIAFTHDHGGSGIKFLIETVGSGLAAADFDNDGWIDVYFIQSAATPGRVADRPLVNTLLRNGGDGTFADVTDHARVGDKGYGLGASAADYDGDGFVDVYVTNFGANRLYRNNGDGTFSEVSAEAGVDDPRVGSSAAWADVDGDGDLDLYVTNYIETRWDNHKVCGTPTGMRSYCGPDVYPAQSDILYINQGDGTFVDGTAAAGVANAIEGKGLGVVFADYDGDGDADIYVANDGERNFLYVNNGDGTFFDDALLAGVGFSEDGRPEAGMGTDWGDYDGDGRLDIIVTNLSRESNSLYRNIGESVFSDVTFSSGLGAASILLVGFGVNWIDVDNDSDLDLFVANGHIIDNIEVYTENITHAQPNHLYINDGSGRFAQMHEQYGPGMGLVKVSRGSAIADLDNDGDIDILVSNNNQSADYLRNDGGSESGNWIQLRLVGRNGNRQAVGARVVLVPASSTARAGAGDTARSDGEAARLIREVKAGSSYQSSSPAMLHVGLGSAERVAVTIRWPAGATEDLGTLSAGRFHVIVEGRGVVATRPAVGSG